MLPIFSIVIPAFNAAATLADALDSIAAQRRGDVEVLVIDGGSKDDTVAIARARSDVVGTVVSEPDRGIYDAINKGIARASGAVVAVLGADDAFTDGAFEQVAHAIATAPADIYAGQAQMVAADGSASLRVDEAYGIGALISGIPFNHNAMFATRQACERIGPYDIGYRLCADAHWVHRAIKAGLTCTRIDRPLVRFALSGASSSDADRIMSETFRTIVENFPCLDTDEAEHLFRTVRGWSWGERVEAILTRHADQPALARAMAVAMLGRARNLTAAAGAAAGAARAPGDGGRVVPALRRIVRAIGRRSAA